MITVLEGIYKAWVVMWGSDGATLFFAGAVVGIFFFLILMTIRDRVRAPPRRAYRRGLVQFSPTEFSSLQPLRPFPGGSSQASSGEFVHTGRVAKALLPPRSVLRPERSERSEVMASTIWDSVWARRSGLAPKSRRGLAPKQAVAPKPTVAPKESRWDRVRRLLAPKRYAKPVAPKSQPTSLAPKPRKKGPGRARLVFDTLVPPPDKQKKRKKKRGKEIVVLDEEVSDRTYIGVEDVR